MLRPAQVNESARVAEIFLASRKTDVPFAPLRHSDAEVRAWIHDVLIPNGTTYVCCDEEKAVGLISLSVRDGLGWIDHLYIHPESTGKGYGTFMLSFAKEKLNGPIRLYTFQQNKSALRFYQRQGFRALAFSDGSENEEQCPDVLLEWRG